ncbi:polysaccharide deacetylase family protein [Geobacter pickeringii]|uniref:Polysaccharide deacetylase n=1 Tax=Geobacter pickeringii TaxID=345632 RepID=A0A0B5BHE0_9BACT|nr:polysaccharide deacetylase family protein [Geobacter pickeringii]AJE03446.1 polysaccharide deacetylase [Geobacter pickeringii]
MDITRRQFMVLTGAALASLSIPLQGAMAMPGAVPVLLYHDISNQYGDPYTISPALFAAQMEWLYANGYRTIAVRDAAAAAARGEKAVVITFDDGYASFIDHAHPLFRTYGFHCTIAVIGAHVGGFIERDGRRPVLSWDEYRYLVADGLVEIACHTQDLHAISRMKSASTAEMEADLMLFQQTVEREMGAKARVLAWPYGIYNRDRIEAAQRAGFTEILTSNEGYLSSGSSLDEVPRLNIGNRLDLVSFNQYLGGKER